jgi:hypothetical protein
MEWILVILLIAALVDIGRLHRELDKEREKNKLR